MSALQFVGKRALTDLDRVTAFSRMIYGDKNAPHSLMPLWMHYGAVGEYLYDRGVPTNTVYGGILQGLFFQSYATLKDLLTFGEGITGFNDEVPPIVQSAAMTYSSNHPANILSASIKRKVLPVSSAQVYLGTHYVKLVRAARHITPISTDFLAMLEDHIIMLTTTINDTLLDDISEDVEDVMVLIKRKQAFR